MSQIHYNGRCIDAPGIFLSEELAIEPDKLAAIAFQHGIINVTRITHEDHELCKANGIEMFKNACCIIANQEIIIGIYEDKELELISFFHEIGHTLVPQPRRITKYQQEKEAWMLGINLAKRYNITFSQRALDWANEKLETYNREIKE